jgi:thiamine-monophosphate kinase
MRISEIGEFGLIERFKKHIKTDSSVIVGSGDDCAVVKFTKKEYLLFTCDMIVEKVDFLKKEDPYLIGRKALAVSISDIAACGGIARYALVSIGIPKNLSLTFVEEVSKGIFDLAREYRVNVVGGDISGAKELIVDVSMAGIVEKNRLVLRKGADKGDIIFVTGEFGGSIYGKHLKFTPRIKEARFLSGNFKPSAMIDISDGLIQDLNHILSQSNAGAVLYEELIPVSKQAKGLNEAFYSGEDFELLFTIHPDKAKKLLARNPFNFKPIGQIMKKEYGIRLIDKFGKETKLALKGFRHF